MADEQSHGKIADPAGTALRAAILGGILGYSLCLISHNWHSRPELPMYIAFLALFHLLEFWTTAKYNRSNVTNKSFLLSSNGLAYWAAQLIGIVEYTIEQYAGVTWHVTQPIHLWSFRLGLHLIIGGQLVRTIAMIQAAQSFSHALAYTKREEHVLVTHGIYSVLRHPSYFGFFWFGLGTQILLANPVSLATFAFILWRFFQERIRAEEFWLMKFFGSEYADYRARVPTRIPGIR